MIRPTSLGVIPARTIATRAASVPRPEVPFPGSAYRRSRIPVRWTIHSSDVSMRRVRSSFRTTREGTARPVPRILAPRMSLSPLQDQDGRGDYRGVFVLHDRRLG